MLTYQIWAEGCEPRDGQYPAMRVVAAFRYFMEALDQRDVYASRGVFSVVRDTTSGASFPAHDITELGVL